MGTDGTAAESIAAATALRERLLALVGDLEQFVADVRAEAVRRSTGTEGADDA